ncbi:DNA-formamidopyrimidine glycosylase [Mycoplasmatota bacterium]|nr:DNA-formamidopyrimidine glycosylase [Mycoplasmatota bacterium]
MPELPEVETVKETLKKVILGSRITSVDIYYGNIIKTSKEEFVKSIKNQVIEDISRRGKYLVFHLSDYYLVSHLRMEGKYFIKRDEEVDNHEHIVFNLDDGRTVRYHDVRKFGTMELVSKEITINEHLSHIGPEPFSEKFNADYLMNLNSKKQLKPFLLDQSVVAGIGNIYVNEICFLAKLHPERITNTLKIQDFESIVVETRNILRKAINLGGTTIKSYTSSLGVTGRFQNELLVHGKNGGCPNCKQPILKIKVGGRGTYYCKNCQK